MIRTILKTEIETLTENFKLTNVLYLEAMLGEVNPHQVSYYLENIRFLLAAYQDLFKAANGTSVRMGETRLAEFFRDRGSEEKGHDDWAKSDIHRLGNFHPSSLCPSTIALLAYLTERTSQDPYPFLAHVLASEYFTVLFGPFWAKALIHYCGIPKAALTVVENHVELDEAHIESGLIQIEALIGEKYPVENFLMNIRKSFDYFHPIFQDIYTEKGVAHESFRIQNSLSDSGSRPRWHIADFFCESVNIGGTLIQCAGIMAGNKDGKVIYGSAADSVSDPTLRCVYEVLERASITLESAHLPSSQANWKPSISNGVAAHSSLSSAQNGAWSELIERDRILRSWYGGRRPIEMEHAIAHAPENYRFRFFHFAPETTNMEVIMCIAEPHSNEGPVGLGYGAARHLDDAIHHAYRETLQRLAFLWGETMPTAEEMVDLTPSPDLHSHAYTYATSLPKLHHWIQGGHEKYRLRESSPAVDLGIPHFVDITPAEVTGRAFVIRALPNGHIPLSFGFNRQYVSQQFPESLLIHPIA